MTGFEQQRATYERAYPADVFSIWNRVVSESEEPPPEALLEAGLRHITRVLVVLAAARARAGDSRPLSAMREKYLLTPGAGALRQMCQCWNVDDQTARVFDPDAPVTADDAPEALRFAGAWASLSGRGSEARVTAADAEVEAALAETEQEPRPWWEVIEALAQMRNAKKHAEELALTMSPRLVGQWEQGILEIGACAPARHLLDHHVVGKASGAVEKDEARGYCDVYSIAGSRRVMVPTSRDLSVLAATTPDVLLHIADREAGRRGVLAGEAVGEFVTIDDAFAAAASSRTVRYDQQASAWLTAGTVTVSRQDSHTALLHLPTNKRVSVTLAGQSSPNNSDFAVDIVESDMDAAMRGRLDALVRAAVKKTIAGINREAQNDDRPTLPPGIAGTITVRFEDPDTALGLDAEHAVVLSTARAVARAVSPALADALQVEVLRGVLGDEHWRPHRDTFGWVDAEDGTLLGAPMACPGADLLLFVPVGAHRPTRGEGLSTALASDPVVTENPTDFESLAACIDATSSRLELLEPHPLGPMLRPLKSEFGAGAVLVSPFTWAAGLLYERDSPGRQEARAWVDRRSRLSSFAVRLVSVAATTAAVGA
jgi:hypothetical protein